MRSSDKFSEYHNYSQFFDDIDSVDDKKNYECQYDIDYNDDKVSLKIWIPYYYGELNVVIAEPYNNKERYDKAEQENVFEACNTLWAFDTTKDSVNGFNISGPDGLFDDMKVPCIETSEIDSETGKPVLVPPVKVLGKQPLSAGQAFYYTRFLNGEVDTISEDDFLDDNFDIIDDVRYEYFKGYALKLFEEAAKELPPVCSFVDKDDSIKWGFLDTHDFSGGLFENYELTLDNTYPISTEEIKNNLDCHVLVGDKEADFPITVIVYIKIRHGDTVYKNRIGIGIPSITLKEERYIKYLDVLDEKNFLYLLTDYLKGDFDDWDGYLYEPFVEFMTKRTEDGKILLIYPEGENRDFLPTSGVSSELLKHVLSENFGKYCSIMTNTKFERVSLDHLCLDEDGDPNGERPETHVDYGAVGMFFYTDKNGKKFAIINKGYEEENAE